MKCPRCDTIITEDAPGLAAFADRILEHCIMQRKLSNAYYNIGLEKAKVRDLSGAILVLKKSLNFNKHNTEARNLLGLVYNEMGETIAALSEWVLSDYLQPEDNRAKYYIDVVQKNQSTLQTVNQTIKKYNSALKEAKNDNEDLAIIQLKKVVSLNPQFVRAYQLLALLYMKRKDYVKAAKVLKRALKIDFNNTTTLRYMQEIGDTFSEPERQRKFSESICQAGGERYTGKHGKCDAGGNIPGRKETLDARGQHYYWSRYRNYCKCGACIPYDERKYTGE